MVWRPKTRHKIRLGVLDFLDGMGQGDWWLSCFNENRFAAKGGWLLSKARCVFYAQKPQASKVHKNIQKLTRLCTPHRCCKGCRYATSDEWGPYCCDGSPLASSCGCPRNLEGEGIEDIRKKRSQNLQMRKMNLVFLQSRCEKKFATCGDSLRYLWNSSCAMRWLWPARFLWRQLLMRSRNNGRVDGKF